MKKHKCRFCGGKLLPIKYSLVRYRFKCAACDCCDYEIELDLKKNIVYEGFQICKKLSEEAGVFTVKCHNHYTINKCVVIFHEYTKFEFEIRLDEIYEIKSVEESVKFFKTYAKNTILL